MMVVGMMGNKIKNLDENHIQQTIAGDRSVCEHYLSGREGTKDLAKKDINLSRELLYTWVSVAITAIATFLLYKDIFVVLNEKALSHSWGHFTQDTIFAAIFLVLIYGNIVYQLARVGYLYRLRQHKRCEGQDTDDLCLLEKTPPLVTILVPSYKEETHIVRQTLLSSALQDYPLRRVVLLIDDPPRPTDPDDLRRLTSARSLPGELQKLFDAAATRYHKAYRQYLERAGEDHLDVSKEFQALSELYEEAANWFHIQAGQYPVQDHTDELFVFLTFTEREKTLRQRARTLFCAAAEDGLRQRLDELSLGYRHLSSLFAVELTSFERKQYVNLSWVSNKAMNLNSYIGLIGKQFNRVVRADGTYLEQTTSDDADLVVPDSSYIVTLDADSLLAPHYVKRLIQIMDRPGNERVAVAQTPYTAVPSPTAVLELIAGATTDVQYIVHQGFTKAHATYWVGANALLRKEALDDIVVYEQERGFTIAKYIQDRTVIEDTESSIDLVVRGWTLFNFPERLSYSATPADFGALLIQRRRWANGGLIILPKLLRHLLRAPHRLRTWVEGFMRVSYLTSIAATNLGMLMILTFHADDYVDMVWLPLTALPYYWIYGRDMILMGYRVRDLFRVYALNFLLIPVNLGGVFKSIQQAVTGKQIPFSRTPKARGRTIVPVGYILAGYSLMLYCFMMGSLDLLDRRWLHGLFAIGSAFVLFYASSAFIGFRNSWEDLSIPFKNWLGRYRESSEAALTIEGVVSSHGVNRKNLLFLIILLMSPLVADSVETEMVSKVPVLIYHKIAMEQTKADNETIHIERFAEQMKYLADHGYHTLKVSELADFMKGRNVPEPSVVLTFDDGWKSVLNAVPVLNRYGFKASFFIITACADGVFGRKGDYLTWEEIGQLAKNQSFEFGSHTVTHPWNPKDNLLSWIEGKNPGKGKDKVLSELITSKLTLENRLSRPVQFLAWPCGWHNQKLVDLATDAGYVALLTTDGVRANLQGDDILHIRRAFANGDWDVETFAKFLGN
jgi:cellulose synthase (UDP-forming)